MNYECVHILNKKKQIIIKMMRLYTIYYTYILHSYIRIKD